MAYAMNDEPARKKRNGARTLAAALGALLAIAEGSGCATKENAGAPSGRALGAADARAALEAGLDDYGAGRYVSAHGHFERASQGPPGAPRGGALYLLGLTELALKQPGRARAALLDAARENDVLGDYALYHAGRAAMEAGDPAGTARIFSDLRLRYGDSRWRAEATLGVGRAFLARGNAAEARAAIDRAIREGLSGDRLPAALLDLGETFEQTQDSAGAVRVYKDLWLTRPETAEADEAERRIARVRGAQGAAGAFATTGERTARADLLFRRFAWEKALPEYQALAAEARASRDREHAWFQSLQAAACLFRLRRYPEAVAAFREVRASFPRHAGVEETSFYEARSLARSQRYDEAFGAFRRLAATHGRTKWGKEARFRLATLLEDRGRLGEAAAEYERVLRSGAREHRGEALWRLGWIDHKRGRDAAARTRFGRLAASSDEVRSRQASYWNARLAEAAGARSDAAARYRTIARSAPFSYYRFAAEVRLRAMGEGPIDDLTPLGSDPSVQAAAAGVALGSHFRRGLALAELRQYEDAGVEMALVPARGTPLDLARIFLGVGAYYEASRLVRAAEAGSGELLRYTYPRAYARTVREEAARHGIDPRLLWAVMREESTFRPAIRSPAGAVGLLQIMPATARRLGGAGGTAAADARLTDPVMNIRLGAFYLGKLLARYGGNAPRAIAGYNAGEEAVDRWLGDMPPAILGDADAFIEEIPFEETRDYVKKVCKSYGMYRRLYPDEMHRGDAEAGAAGPCTADQILRSRPSQNFARSSRLSGLPLGL